ncbi:TlpA disulfide reductase family protein [Dinghuibacter silviterrae]|uniref:Peroxiredoxin n=1 Tax=Dinghuibacter silviterrae TaxID=1539049 RepID=A0A4R8DVR8_9BACT|nr:TlpA disulfide reductase family protein [Dinghuibacter silviterrae]TDX01565.1 peroxiredoxin [Dinghuibacter silviterrae]
MIKNWIYLALALAPIGAGAQTAAGARPGGTSAAAPTFDLHIRLTAAPPVPKAYLVTEFEMTDQKVLDSAVLVKGACTFKGPVTDPAQKVTLVVGHLNVRDADSREIFLEAGRILLQGRDSIRTASIKAPALNMAYADYAQTVLEPVNRVGRGLNAAYQAASEERRKSPAFMDSLKMVMRFAWHLRDSLKTAYIAGHPDTYVSLLALQELAGKDIDLSKIEPLFDGLSDSVRSSKAGQAFAAVLERARPTSIGAVAPDFSEPDTSGAAVRLSDFRGKYVLLDFWASWCGPCRAENPNVVKAYAAFKDKNFTVLGVSLDGENTKGAWLKAIQKDSLTWTQVSDLQAWNNAAAKKYGIRSIPQNFLIDPQGKIVGKNLRGEELEKQLGALGL